jgi:hypothetical protein
MQAVSRGGNGELVVLYKMYLREIRNEKMAEMIEEMKRQAVPRVRVCREKCVAVKRRGQPSLDERKEEGGAGGVGEIAAPVFTSRPTLMHATGPQIARIVLGPPGLKKVALGRQAIENFVN